MKILIVSSEVVPFTGQSGLADFAGALPFALHKLGHDVRVITPKYKVTDEGKFQLQPVVDTMNVPISNRMEACSILEGKLDQTIPAYFIKKDAYYQRDHLYGDSQGDYPDNAERFIYFSRSIPEACKHLHFFPDIIHSSDWQTGLVSVYIRQLYKSDPAFAQTGLVYTVHNLGYQGLFWHYDMHLTGLGWELFTPDGLEYYGKINLMKGGLMWADIITTVSPTYAQEIQTQEFGHGLEGVLQYRSKELFGVVNGVDYAGWIPETNPVIAQPYRAANLAGKTACKKDLLQRFDLPVKPSVPLVGMISPFDNRKGFDLLENAMEEIMKLDLTFILLGTGHEKYQKMFLHLREKYSKKFGVRVAEDPEMAQKILAGADMLLLPSRYEPGGEQPIYSLRYGTVPIAHATGGLNDTIKDFNAAAEIGTGIKFHEYSADALFAAIKTAIAVYGEKQVWKSLLSRCMTEDFSWDITAQAYETCYQTAQESLTGKT